MRTINACHGQVGLIANGFGKPITPPAHHGRMQPYGALAEFGLHSRPAQQAQLWARLGHTVLQPDGTLLLLRLTVLFLGVQAGGA